LVSDISAGDGNIEKLFLRCIGLGDGREVRWGGGKKVEKKGAGPLGGGGVASRRFRAGEWAGKRMNYSPPRVGVNENGPSFIPRNESAG
jgi:hypothetical protein